MAIDQALLFQLQKKGETQKIKELQQLQPKSTLSYLPSAIKETAVKAIKKAPEILMPALTNFTKKSTGIIGESMAYALDPNVREQYIKGNIDILPNVSYTTPTQMLKDTFAAGLEASIYKYIPKTIKMGILQRFGVGALQGVGFAVSEGLAKNKTAQEIIDNAKSYGKVGGAIEVAAPYIFPLLKSELKNLPSAVRKVFSGLEKEAKEVPVGLSLKDVSKEVSQPAQKLPSELAQAKTITEKTPEGLSPELRKNPEISDKLSLESPYNSSIQKITQALKEVKPIRGQQEKIFTQERGAKMARALSVGEKTGGESGFYSELGQLKGEMTKVQFESIRNKIGQEDIDNLFNQVKNSPLDFWDSVSARNGLVKMFDGRIPTNGEISLLNKIFPKELTQEVLAKRSLWSKAKEAGLQLANIPRSVMASVDLSAPFRQGVFLIGKPKRFAGAFYEMVKAFGSEKSFKAIQETIAQKPTFNLMKESDLALTEMDSILSQREERFMSQWSEKIPIVGRIIRASGRAYTGFLNKLRADVFEDLINKAEKLGLSPAENPDLSKSIANFVNVASGRGSLGKLQPAAVALNSFFFSPRLMASRLTLLNPIYYIKQPPFVRKEAIKALLTFGGYTASLLGLAKVAGANVETNPKSSDFGKIKVGDTRIDIMGGFQQYIRMASQLITGKYISSTTGKEITLGEGYKPLTRYDILLRQVESKEAPIFSFITDLLKQQDYQGKPINIPKEIGSRFVPMAISDIIELYKDDPNLLPISALGIFGFGVQTYTTNKKKPANIGQTDWSKIKVGNGGNVNIGKTDWSKIKP